MRTVPAQRVASPWGTVQDFGAESHGFWNAKQRLPKYFQWSAGSFPESSSGQVVKEGSRPRFPSEELPIFFLSHAWDAPDNWAEVMGVRSSYQDLKATHLCAVAKDLAAAYL